MTRSASPPVVSPAATPAKVAADHYHRYVQDLDLMERLGLRSYRFSISWSRVLPARKGTVNRKGVDFYRRLVDGLRDRDIEPVATLWHWDTPQAGHRWLGGARHRAALRGLRRGRLRRAGGRRRDLPHAQRAEDGAQRRLPVRRARPRQAQRAGRVRRDPSHVARARPRDAGPGRRRAARSDRPGSEPPPDVPLRQLGGGEGGRRAAGRVREPALPGPDLSGGPIPPTRWRPSTGRPCAAWCGRAT